MEPVSILMKAEKFALLRRKGMYQKLRGPSFFPPLFYICYDVTQITSSPRTTVFQYKLEIIFLSLYNVEDTVEVECNYNDVFFVR